MTSRLFFGTILHTLPQAVPARALQLLSRGRASLDVRISRGSCRMRILGESQVEFRSRCYQMTLARGEVTLIRGKNDQGVAGSGAVKHMKRTAIIHLECGSIIFCI